MASCTGNGEKIPTWFWANCSPELHHHCHNHCSVSTTLLIIVHCCLPELSRESLLKIIIEMTHKYGKVKDDNADVDDSGLWNPGWQNTRSCEVGQLKLAFSLDLVLDQKIYEYHITSQCLQLQSVLS